MFKGITSGPPDGMLKLKIRADADNCPNKVDIGTGIYQDENGKYKELGVVHEAKKILAERNPGHNYEVTTGDPKFVRHAQTIIFGENSPLLQAGKVASVQTIAGTGALHLGATLIAQYGASKPKVFLGLPAWPNYHPLFTLAGLEIVTYTYYDLKTRSVDFENMLKSARTAPASSVFILQAVCHNPTGADLSDDQWRTLCTEMKAKSHSAFFDVAYAGLGRGIDEDTFCVRHFAASGIEMCVAQSFSKNFALYGERLGAFHYLSGHKEGEDSAEQTTVANVADRLRCLIRWEFSSSPAYASRIVSIVLENDKSRKD